MKAFHLVDSYFSREFKNLPVTRQMNAIFGEENVLPFWDAMKLNEPLVCSHAWLGKTAKDAINHIDRLEALASYSAPLITFFRSEGGWQAGALPIEMVRCFDFVFAFNPEQVPFPATRWYRTWPDMIGAAKGYDEKVFELCYVGRPEPRRKPTWIAAMLQEVHGTAIVAMTLTGPSGIVIYNTCSERGIERLHNPTREQINDVFNDSRFLVYPTDLGPRPYDTLENAMAEAIVCECAPILNTAYCNGRFKNYPAQIGSVDDARRMAHSLDTKLWDDCLNFMYAVDALDVSCARIDDLRKLLHEQRYVVDPDRKDRCRRVIEHVKAGKHVVPFNQHGPFYVVIAEKSMNFYKTEYL